jgi:hypothetical protein
MPPPRRTVRGCGGARNQPQPVHRLAVSGALADGYSPHRAVTPYQRQSGADGRSILEPPFREGSSCLYAGLLHHRAPGIQRVAATLTEHVAEGLDVAVRARHHRVKAEEMGEQGMIARALGCRVRQKQACGPERGQGKGEPSGWCASYNGAGGTWRNLRRVPVSRRHGPTVPLHRHP